MYRETLSQNRRNRFFDNMSVLHGVGIILALIIMSDALRAFESPWPRYAAYGLIAVAAVILYRHVVNQYVLQVEAGRVLFIAKGGTWERVLVSLPADAIESLSPLPEEPLEPPYERLCRIDGPERPWLLTGRTESGERCRVVFCPTQDAVKALTEGVTEKEGDEYTPPDLWRILLKDARRDWTCFHMPGHVRGRGFPRPFRSRLAAMDITEVAGMDDLNHPQGILRQAQEKLARLMGADRSLFLTNGASMGIIAMMTALCRPGDKLIVPRASHRAVYHALVQGGIDPVYLFTGWLDGRPLPPSPEDAEKMLAAHPDVAGMILTSPDYWGRCPDTEGIARVLHSRGKALLLDQAHGAHFGFHPALPPHGGQTGADAWVQSAHKTLPALTQSAWLHIRDSGCLSADRLMQKIRLLQTTSPSYPMMGALDYARCWLENHARDAYDGLLDRIGQAVSEIEKNTPVRRVDFSRERGVRHTDPTRLALDVSGIGANAKETEGFLLTQGIRVEWAEGNTLVLICTPWHRQRDFRRLVRALKRCPRSDAPQLREAPPPLPEPEIALPMGQALDRPSDTIPLAQAAGRVAAAFVIPYPPGIPLLCPGEVIAPAHIRWIEGSGSHPAGLTAAGYIPVVQ